MQPQLLFFDIDGTLLSNDTHQIPESALNAIAAAQKNGHLAFINTGRTFRTMPAFLKELGFDGFLCGCGTRIVCRGETLLAHSLSEEERRRIIDLLEEWQIEAFLEGSEDVYCQRRDYRQKVMNIVRASFNKEGLGLSKFIEDRNFVFDKFVFVSDNTANSDAFIRSITSFIDVIDRGKGMYECVPKGFSKASAMQLLSKHLNISMDNTWAFGDSSNGLPMFEAAAHGIAMGDHSSVLEPFSEMITDTVDNDGIAKALSHFGLS